MNRASAMMMRMATAAAVVALAACTSAGHTPPKAYVPVGGEIDQQRVAYVEAKAARRNVQVHWINPPRVADKE